MRTNSLAGPMLLAFACSLEEADRRGPIMMVPTDPIEVRDMRCHFNVPPLGLCKAERDSANKAAAERMRNMRARRYQKPVEPAKPEDVRELLRCNGDVTSGELPAKFALPDPVPSRPVPIPYLKKKTLLSIRNPSSPN